MTQGFDFPRAGTLSRPPQIDDAPGKDFELVLKKHKIATSEYARIKEILGGSPTLAELGVFSAMWSEHCSYKSSRIHLRRFPTEGPNVVVGPGENAGVVRISGKLCLAFKMESHNHPSYIEPYQGAATGVGGILRDVFCMGARPIANLNALRFGVRSHNRTSHLQEFVVKGIGDYGNCMGIPTVAGNISFDESYNGNCLVNAMTIGTIHEDRIFKGYASGQGNLVVYLGSATGRDGIHGATMASDSFDTAANSERSTVQVGDPFTEKLLLEATLEVLEKNLVVGLQDMGAAGLTSSAFEMAGRAGNGLFMDLDKVPVRAKAMTAYELLLSESQERMLMVIKPENWQQLKEVLDKWQLACTVIGVVTDTARVQVHYQGRLEVDIPVDPVTEKAPKYERPIRPRKDRDSEAAAKDFDAEVARAIRDHGSSQALSLFLGDTGDKQPIYDQYDHHIGVKTVHGPDHQGAAVLWLRSDWADANEPYLGVAAAASCNERYCRNDPHLGAAHAVLKAARMLAAAGATPLAITDCLNYGNPEDPEVMWEFSEGVDGITEACKQLGIQVVSGNVSLYNETDGKSIAPTPMIGMVGRMRDVRVSPPAIIKEAAQLYLLHRRDSSPVFGGSLAAKLLLGPGRRGSIPAIDWPAEREAMAFIQSLTTSGKVLAARDVGDGGIVTTATKMMLGRGLGLTIDLSQGDFATKDEITRAFGELSGAYLIALSSEEAALLESLQHKSQTLRFNTIVSIGRVHKGGDIRFDSAALSHAKAEESFHHSLL